MNLEATVGSLSLFQWEKSKQCTCLKKKCKNQIKYEYRTDKEKSRELFLVSHSIIHVEVYEKNSRFYIELDATCLIELKNIAAEFGDDNIVILPGNNAIRLYIDSLDKQFKTIK